MKRKLGTANAAFSLSAESEKRVILVQHKNMSKHDSNDNSAPKNVIRDKKKKKKKRRSLSKR